MIDITEAYVDSLALNSSAIKNGKDLVKKNSFPKLCKTEDGTLIFGECKGSGSSPYFCSADYVKADEPVFRCSCPSRQFPCKHLLGLMYAYAAGKPFETADIPQDIADKREKAEKREDKKKEAANATVENGSAAAPKRKSNKSALLKKIAAQLEGLDIADTLVLQLVQSGLGSLDKKTLKTVEDQVKQLGNYYIPGIQTTFRELLLQFQSGVDSEKLYTNVSQRLTTLHALLKKSRAYLQNKIEHPDASMDSESTLEEWIGHAWQIAELREYGRTRHNVELLQLAFRSYTDQARGEFIDEGHWVNLQTGEIHATRTYRPFRAAKYIREEDTVFQVVTTKEMVQYPGELNARVRWEDSVLRDAGVQDYEAVRAFASRSFPEVIKQVKNQIKNQLSDKNPVLLVFFSAIKRSEDGYMLIDEQGKQLPLANIEYLDFPTVELISFINKQYVRNQAMLLMFEHSMEHNRLTAQPLSIVTPGDILRLLY
ncbi:SWIM zinc finger family protein [Paenibacillus eucommiae]|uniref:SWIM-type domain-containing protein n=1 Tax=Paenibacillus eucommiae TaxID=1355755 RepID=A0ABS4IWG6_9BACL|nr:SWIM zinc finger family protein [Paenibacillus eucommiae]MBP1991907.1 hypothetical protein [Paenibacillus eucommiae]